MPDTVTITQEVTLPVTPVQVYDALVNPKKHSDFTGAKATGKGIEGGAFSAWDGYITGTYRRLQRARLIEADWETSEWPEGAAPSKLLLTFDERDGQTVLTMVHSNVPASQAEAYRQGWIDYYWTPLSEYFAKTRKAPG
jgi:activator of HSP90 ATPase